MGPRHRQWREHPYLLVVDEQMGTRLPVHLVAIIYFEIKHVLFRKSVGPLGKRWHRRVVQNNERRTPRGPMQCMSITVEFISGICVSYNSFPLTHFLLLFKSHFSTKKWRH